MIDLHLVVDEFKRIGYDATLEGGGAAIPFIRINLRTAEVATYAPCLGYDLDGGWGGMIYPNTTSFDNGIDDRAEVFDTDVPNDSEVARDIVKGFLIAVSVKRPIH